MLLIQWPTGDGIVHARGGIIRFIYLKCHYLIDQVGLALSLASRIDI